MSDKDLTFPVFFTRRVVPNRDFYVSSPRSGLLIPGTKGVVYTGTSTESTT